MKINYIINTLFLTLNKMARYWRWASTDPVTRFYLTGHSRSLTETKWRWRGNVSSNAHSTSWKKYKEKKKSKKFTEIFVALHESLVQLSLSRIILQRREITWEKNAITARASMVGQFNQSATISKNQMMIWVFSSKMQNWHLLPISQKLSVKTHFRSPWWQVLDYFYTQNWVKFEIVISK